MKKNQVINSRAAFTSCLISLLLCVAMFAGTTYAWFSDSVTNRSHIIAGNLDVELEYYDLAQNKWLAVDSATKLLDDGARWEPGYTEVVYLRVRNYGSLALKYQLGVSVNDEISGVNQNGERFKLSDHIMFGVTKTEIRNGASFEFAKYNETDADRKAARDSVKDTAAQIGLGYYSKAATLSGERDIDYVTMVIYMPEDVGSVANAQLGKDASIDLAIDLIATQANAESDGFGNAYDKDAELFLSPVARVSKMTPAQLTAANAQSFLVADITGAFTVIPGATAALDFGYVFHATESGAEVQESVFQDFYAEFAVSFDRNVAAGSVGLAGQYDAFLPDTWVAFDLPADLAAGEQFCFLRESGMDPQLTYAEFCESVQRFQCGAFNHDAANVGTTVTVELRLTNPENAADVRVIGTYNYTLTA